MFRARLTFLLSLFLAASGAWAQDFVPGRFIVQFDEPAAKGAVREAAVQRKELARQAVAERGGVVRYSLDQVLNALIVDIDDARRGELEALPGVRRVYPDRRMQLDMDHAVDLVRARDAWRAAGGVDSAGKGVKIAIVDTGIDITHPAFQDNSLAVPEGFPKYTQANDLKGTSHKVIVARSYGNIGAPDIRDLIGHGTSVASAAAGARHKAPVGEFTGIAPKAFLGIYRMDDSDGSFTSSALLRALEDVARDGMDVMNLSLGFFPQTRFEDDPVAQAVERLAEHVIVTKSAGNMGPDAGLSTAPASPSAITVGASWNERALGPSVEVPGLGGLAATRPDSELPAEPLTGELVDAAHADPTGLVCTAPPAGSFDGKVVLILRGDCTFEAKVNFAAGAGARGVIIYTNSNPLATLWSMGGAPLPAVMVSNENGARMKGALAAAGEASEVLGVKISFDLGTITLDANQVAGFSSRGPGIAGNVHVDLVAPGYDIFLAAQKANVYGEIYSPTGYAVEAGTSFSSPMVAGAAAVLKSTRPGLAVKQYKSLLVNSAARFARGDGRVFGVQAAGAGRLDLEQALRTMTAADPVSVSFGSGPVSMDVTRELRLTNLGATEDTLAINVAPLGDSAAASVSPSSITLAPGQTRVVAVRLSGAALEAGEHQGFLLIRGSQSEVELRVPYWYGASDKVARRIWLMARTASIRQGGLFQYLMRVADASGMALNDTPPVIEAIEGDGRVESIQSLDANFPGMWLVNLRMGTLAEVNVFRFAQGEAERTVTLRP